MKLFTENDAIELADYALHQACLVIQDSLGVKSGDVAGLFFTGEKGDQFIALMKQYIFMELSYMREDDQL